MCAIRRQAAPAIVLAAVFVGAVMTFAAPSAADCMSGCQGDYYACSHAYSDRDCATARSICQQGCILRGSDRYGAIALSGATGKFGFSFDYPSRVAAERRALAECRSRSEAGDCAIEIWFYNTCGALALGPPPARGSAYAADEAAARGHALRACNAQSKGAACEVKTAVCSK
jgi:serine/threonine-protein kinase